MRCERVPRFFFNVYDENVALDEEGQFLPNLPAAYEEAKRGAIELACAELTRGRLNLNHRIEVADDTGQVVAVVRYRDTVEIED